MVLLLGVGLDLPGNVDTVSSRRPFHAPDFGERALHLPVDELLLAEAGDVDRSHKMAGGRISLACQKAAQELDISERAYPYARPYRLFRRLWAEEAC